MNFKFNNNTDVSLNYIVENLVEVMASNSIDNTVSLSGWDKADVVSFANYADGIDGNIADLAKLVIDKIEQVEDKVGTYEAIEVFRDANKSILKDNELHQLFDRVDQLSDEYEPAQDVKATKTRKLSM